MAQSSSAIQPNTAYYVAFPINAQQLYLKSNHASFDKPREQEAQLWWGVDFEKQKVLCTPAFSTTSVVFEPVRKIAGEDPIVSNQLTKVRVRLFIPASKWVQGKLTAAPGQPGEEAYVFWCQNERHLKFSRSSNDRAICTKGECSDNCPDCDSPAATCAQTYEFNLLPQTANAFQLFSNESLTGTGNPKFNGVQVPINVQLQDKCNDYLCGDLGFNANAPNRGSNNTFYVHPAIAPSVAAAAALQRVELTFDVALRDQIGTWKFWVHDWPWNQFDNPYTHLKLAFLIFLGVILLFFMAMLGARSGFILLLIVAAAFAVFLGVLYYRRRRASDEQKTASEAASTVVEVPKVGEGNEIVEEVQTSSDIPAGSRYADAGTPGPGPRPGQTSSDIPAGSRYADAGTPGPGPRPGQTSSDIPVGSRYADAGTPGPGPRPGSPSPQTSRTPISGWKAGPHPQTISTSSEITYGPRPADVDTPVGPPDACSLGSFGRDTGIMRVYTKPECDALGGKYFQNGECLKAEGGSYSWDCRRQAAQTM
jgi:Ca2+/Na+ antiporter